MEKNFARERELDSRDFHQTYTRSGNKEKNQWEKKINRHIQWDRFNIICLEDEYVFTETHKRPPFS